ncbi:DUF1592 domain-containing protein [Myxococcaceae bacterium JPH2]|nr:DUF1592 domain-containing protein [Myxococcaceae bacterium JPH2]
MTSTNRRRNALALTGLALALVLAACPSNTPPKARVLPGPDAPPPEEPAHPPPVDNEAACRSDARDPGRVTLHRLNRAEYDNTVRDLLGDTTHPAREFPADDHGFGFDNNADVLSMSPLLMEKYSSAAERLVDEAWARGDLGARCVMDTVSPEPCARDILAAFAHRAWRRAVTDAEVTRLLGFLSLARQHGDSPEVGLKLALRAVLVSPHFLFRVEKDPASTTGAEHPLSDDELASRLSYFLWSSMPDEELRAAADDGTLQDPAVLERQVHRMLGDAKAQALVDNFAGQWLYTRALDAAEPDVRYGFDEPLRLAMHQETSLFFREFLTSDLPMKDLLDAPFTYVNDRLAAHYGLPPVGGEELKRVSLRDRPERAGILAQGSLLTVTSNPDRTSPVKRGVWVLEQLLCKAPPPPPPNVEGLPSTVDPRLNIKARMKMHRSQPSCAGCHSLMDPLGFGLENFDPVGRWRVKEEGGAPVDSGGELPDGTTFTGVMQMRQIVKSDPDLAPCFTEHLLTYALGRGTTTKDQCAVRDIVKQAEARGGRLGDYILGVIQSNHFTHRRAETETPRP